jgi:cytochrome P450
MVAADSCGDRLVSLPCATLTRPPAADYLRGAPTSSKEPLMVTAQFNPIGPEALSNPYPMYKALREENPVHWNDLMEAWIFTRYDDVDAILMNPSTSADRTRAQTRFSEMIKQQQEQFGPFSQAPTMLTSDPPEHTRLRRLVSKAFTPRAVENLRPRIRQIVDELLDGVQGRSEFDLVEELAYPLPVIVIAEMLGVPPQDRADFKRWSDDVVATLGGPFTPPEVIEKARKSIDELVEYLAEQIAERRVNPRDDLISGLIAAEDGGQVLSEIEIYSTTILLLIAGNETTTNLIGNAMYSLLKNPDQLELLRGEPSLMPSAIEELIRFNGPVQATGRVAKEKLEVGGTTIEENQIALVILGAANHDPAKYPDPEKLDLRRNPTDHLGFGDGIHFCIGAPLARAEGQIAFEEILRRFPRIELAGDPTWGGTFIIRGAKKLPLAV